MRWTYLLSVCTKTLWIGHLNKQTTEDDLRREVESYGEVELMTVSMRAHGFISSYIYILQLQLAFFPLSKHVIRFHELQAKTVQCIL